MQELLLYYILNCKLGLLLDVENAFKISPTLSKFNYTVRWGLIANLQNRKKIASHIKYTLASCISY